MLSSKERADYNVERWKKSNGQSKGRPTLPNIFGTSLMTRLFLYGVWGGYPCSPHGVCLAHVLSAERPEPLTRDLRTCRWLSCFPPQLLCQPWRSSDPISASVRSLWVRSLAFSGGLTLGRHMVQQALVNSALKDFNMCPTSRRPAHPA